ncbi:MerR family transcriptional regulator [Desulfovibrio psychrotolerans]|uniref:HTH merR-type domain-containing protein n=1 Tax=Desulfovibrio psychrotolerans TaxID=415242 RepID=A0A7J0BZE5_9BACT|nr:MerR family transcriptional regulator [Desulfovibrio psychrotolerans]GFM38575.1 hypothetical protein DSM19430T_32590 [Desulfovibrio psychrotolerans]
MSEKTFTHKELGRLLGVSETTVKSYRRKFPDCIPVANEGKPIRFTEQAGAVCLRIRELFGRGMAVPEVRARLEKDFPWIGPAPEPEQEQAPVMPAGGPMEVELPQDYTQAMSNLAKSMVNLTMKQDAIVRRMDAMEGTLERLAQVLAPKAAAGTSGGTFAGTADGAGNGATGPNMYSLPGAEAWMARANALLERLEGAALAAAPFAGTADSPAVSSERAPEQRSSASGERAEASGNSTEASAVPGESVGESGGESGLGATPSDLAQNASVQTSGQTSASPSGQSSDQSSGQSSDRASAPAQAPSERPLGKVVRIRNAYGDVNEYTLETADAVSDPAQAEPESGARPVVAAGPQEPPRSLLTMPLVIQSPEGEFLGVAGRTRGRFSINDLKAMLMSHYTGLLRYTSNWQLTDNGWLMTLEQKDAPESHTLALLVEQTTTPRGNNVALIEHLMINGRDENPVEMYNFINRIYEQ